MIHFSGKNRVEQYIRTLPIKSAFIYPGFYSQNVFMFPPFAFRVGKSLFACVTRLHVVCFFFFFFVC